MRMRWRKTQEESITNGTNSNWIWVIGSYAKAYGLSRSKSWITKTGCAIHKAKVNDWENRSAAYRDGLLKKWRQDIARHQEQISILRGVLKEKGDGE